jgi:hypothetical protein
VGLSIKMAVPLALGAVVVLSGILIYVGRTNDGGVNYPQTEGPRVMWTSPLSVEYDYSLFTVGTIVWNAPVKFKNIGGDGEITITAELQDVGTVTRSFQVDAGKEYTLRVSGTIRVGSGALPKTWIVSSRLRVTSVGSEGELDPVTVQASCSEYPSDIRQYLSLGSIQLEEYVPPPPVPDWASVSILSISPPPGAELHNNDILTAEVQYRVDSSYVDPSQGIVLRLVLVQELPSARLVRTLKEQTCSGTENTVVLVSDPLAHLQYTSKSIKITVEISAVERETGERISRTAENEFEYSNPAGS